MRKLVILIGLGLLAVPALATAQTNPCDAPDIAGTQQVVGTTFTFHDCLPSTAPVTTVTIVLDGVSTTVPAPAPGPANATGLVPYTITLTGLTKGQHTVNTKYSSTGGAGPVGNPFALSVVDPIPPAPLHKP